MKPQTNKPRGNLCAATLKQAKPIYLIMGGFFALTTIAMLCMKISPVTKPEEARYELETSGSGINFHAPELKTHTAADGIAVIGTSKLATAVYNVSVPSAPDLPAMVPSTGEPAQSVTAPAGIPQEEAPATHGGFTVPVPMDDESIGILTVPDIDLTVRVYESDDDMENMEKGASHFKSTSAWMGNVGISAHNIALDGSPGYFLNLHKLTPGAVIQYETALGSRAYTVESVTEISENDWSKLGRTEDNRITLITCISGKPSLRLCVQGVERQG